MKCRSLAALPAAAALLLFLSDLGAVSQSASQPHAVADYGRIPLGFEANQGQFDPAVRFTARGSGYSLFLTANEAVLELNHAHRGVTPSSASAASSPAGSGSTPAVLASQQPDVIRMHLAGAQPAAQIIGEDRLPGSSNYFMGNDPGRWHANVPTWARVKYAGVYPGVDLVYYGNQRRLEYDFVVAPHADASPIRLRFDGATRLRVDGRGDLELSAMHAGAVFQKPVIYQNLSGRRQPVEGRFALASGNTVRFELGSYDHARPLVIDPVLIYSTFLGGTSGDYGVALAVDKDGYTYVVGATNSGDFPVKHGGYQTVKQGGESIFIAKLYPGGTALEYSTFLGAIGGISAPSGIAIDAEGNAYIGGGTTSAAFPVTKGAYDTKWPGTGAAVFVAKLNPAGSKLVYSTFFDPGVDVSGTALTAIAVNSAGEAYITGAADWELATTPGVFEGSVETGLRTTAFVSKLNAEGTKVLLSTYTGATSQPPGTAASSVVTSIALDAAGDVYLTGLTFDDFPVTKGAFETAYKGGGYQVAFVEKLNSSFTDLDYATFLSGSKFLGESDGAPHIAVDAERNAYIAGTTTATDFPVTRGAFQRIKAGQANNLNVYVAKLGPKGSSLDAATYLGGGATTEATGVGVDKSGDIIVAGTTHAGTFPTTTNAIEPGGGAVWDGFVSRFNSTLTKLSYSTFWGGNYDTMQGGMTLDASGNVYVTGNTFSTAFPITPNAFQKVNNDQPNYAPDCYVSKISFSAVLVPTITTVVSDANPLPAGSKVVFTAYVRASEDAGVITGKVAFSVDGGTPVDVVLDDTGHAEYSTSALKKGSHTVKATYLGSLAYATSSGTLKETITALRTNESGW